MLEKLKRWFSRRERSTSTNMCLFCKKPVRHIDEFRANGSEREIWHCGECGRLVVRCMRTKKELIVDNRAVQVLAERFSDV